MSLYLPLSEEQKMVKELNVLNRQTSALIETGRRNGIEIQEYITHLNEIREELTKEERNPLLKTVILKAHIFKHYNIQKNLRRRLFYQLVPSAAGEKGSQNMSLSHRCSDFELRVSEICFEEWGQKALREHVDIQDFQEKIHRARELRRTYLPPQRTPYNDLFARLFYIHYLNLYTNKIICKVAKHLIQKNVELLKRDPLLKEKMGLIQRTEEWLLKQMPKAEVFDSPIALEQEATCLLKTAEEKRAQIYAYKIKR